jgi:hypothetical protein
MLTTVFNNLSYWSWSESLAGKLVLAMNSHHLTIAKATFAASLLRPGSTTARKDELPEFHQLLEKAMLKCSPSNVQVC